MSTDKRAFPVKITPYYQQLARDLAAQGDSSLLRQVMPSPEEETLLSYELTDPLGEAQWRPLGEACLPLVRRYPSRALFLATDQCRLHCRHCFRRSSTGRGRGAAASAEIEAAARYLGETPEVKELLITGGDPLTLPLDVLEEMFRRFREARPDLILRVGSRLPVVDPGAFSSELISLLAEYQQPRAALWLSLQYNHPAEITPESEDVLYQLARAGVPLLNQTVLLRGVNDDPLVLAELFQELTARRVKPYYLFQGDLAPGTGHFRVPLKRAWAIYAELRRRLSGLTLPVFALDIPGGGGKVPLEPSFLVKEDENWYYFRGPDGAEGRYPKEEARDGR